MKSIEWLGNRVRYLDQTKLPLREVYVETDRPADIAAAIRSLAIRGAPLIGVAAAYGAALAGLQHPRGTVQDFRARVQQAVTELASTRPTAVNLFWALERMKQVLSLPAASVEEAGERLVAEAEAIHREDREMCRLIGRSGAGLLPDRGTVLTHCNAGALATGGEGTALNVIVSAHRAGKSISVYACETRPLFQGARLTAWELMKAGVDVVLITDSTAASLMERRAIDCVVVGADRITRRGDVANKVGTYMHALAAGSHGIPFYVAAPSSTIDPSIEDGSGIPIEQRGPAEVTGVGDARIAPEGIKVYSPAFDITPARLVSAIITEKGIHRFPFDFHRDE